MRFFSRLRRRWQRVMGDSKEDVQASGSDFDIISFDEYASDSAQPTSRGLTGRAFKSETDLPRRNSNLPIRGRLPFMTERLSKTDSSTPLFQPLGPLNFDNDFCALYPAVNQNASLPPAQLSDRAHSPSISLQREETARTVSITPTEVLNRPRPVPRRSSFGPSDELLATIGAAARPSATSNCSTYPRTAAIATPERTVILLTLATPPSQEPIATPPPPEFQAGVSRLEDDGNAEELVDTEEFDDSFEL